MKKLKIMSLFVTISMLFSSLTVNAVRLNVLYQKVDETVLSEGVIRTDYKMLSTVGWINANVVTANLNNKHIDMRPIFSDNGTSNLVTTKTLAVQNNAIAAVNADFFAWAKDKTKGSSIGLLVRDGKLLTTPANNNEMAALVQDNTKFMNILYPSSYIQITSPNNLTMVVKHINKYDDLAEPVIYTNTFQNTPLSLGDEICKAIVTNGILTEIRTDNTPIELSDKTYVIAFLNDHSMFMYDNFKIGDKVKLDIQTDPTISEMKNAIGGGTQLVTEGKPAKITHQVSGSNPRTAAGTDKTGKILYLITVDGRGQSKGLSLEALTEFMITIGVYNGINFDGGGSTMMATRELGEAKATVANVPSETRPISNALAVVSTAPVGKLYGLKTTADTKYVFKNTSCNLKTLAYDNYYNPVAINANDVKYSVTGVEGSFNGIVFKPTTSGTAIITASYGGVTTKFEINVLDEPSSLNVSTKNVNVSDKAEISVMGKDKDGYSAPIYINDLKIDINKKIADVIDGNIVKKGEGDTILSLSLGNAKAYVGVSTKGNADNIKLQDDAFVLDYLKKTNTNTTTFTVFGGGAKPDTLLQNLILKKSINEMNSFNKHFFVGDIDKTVFEGINGSMVITNGYGDQKDENSHYIWLNNRKGGLKDTANEQWPWLISKVSKSDKKNIFIFLPVDIYNGGFTDSLEADAFFDTLKTEVIDKGKNCFVFANNATTNVRRINGIRYITTGGIQGNSLSIFMKDMNKTKYVTVTVNGNEVNYDFKNIFN